MPTDTDRPLRNYYLLRFAVSALWAAAVLTLGRQSDTATAILLIAYPAWDAAANFADALRNGGLSRNPTQATNVAVSTLATIAVAATLGHGMNAVLAVFAAWAALSGFLQLLTGARRWTSHGAQWAMILSGAQSMLAGALMARVAAGRWSAGLPNLAPYAAFGAFYFLVSALWLSVGAARRRARGAAY
ncbi:DUF308 domain-containing protein [Acetobacteraceae bacterium KSS8]|uniref:DUF308 domain-containing protein n=1 Tax=Endosaccharibacter trunci TaxID=2812733 RepID=A0ABT1WCM5_9PROT|nr:DUF308 domain-containing protein [Acetobacteraceae bacterium KSS8]